MRYSETSCNWSQEQYCGQRIARNNRNSSLVYVFLQANINLMIQVFQNLLILENADTTFTRNVGKTRPNTVVSLKTCNSDITPWKLKIL
jgi:hypothetical protein